MATLFLTLAAGGLGLTAGTAASTFAFAAAATIGGLLDTRIFGNKPPEGPKLDTLPVNTFSEGSPMWQCHGPSSRVPGQHIYSGPLREKSRRVGGKGGGGQKVKSYNLDIAVAFCEGEVEEITRVYADGKMIFAVDRSPSVTGTDISLVRRRVADVNDLDNNPAGFYSADIFGIFGGTDLSVFTPGYDVVISGFANAANNGTFRCLKSGVNADGTSDIRVVKFKPWISTTEFVAEAAGASVTISQTVPDLDPKYAAGIFRFNGSATQTPSATIEAAIGAGLVPAYRHRAYIVISALQLGHFGNRIPSFTADVKADDSLTVRALVARILERRGFQAKQYDVTGIDAGLTIIGYPTRGAINGQEALASLMLAYDLATQEYGGKLYFWSRANLPRVAVEANKLGAHQEGGSPPRVVRMTDGSLRDVPEQVVVNYRNRNNRQQAGSQRYRGVSERSNTIWNIELGELSVSDSFALDRAKQVYWTARANIQTARCSLPPSEMLVTTNDVIQISQDGEDYDVLLNRVDLGANESLECEGVVEVASTLNITGSHTDAYSEDQDRDLGVGQLAGVIVDVAPLSDEHYYTPGLYFLSSQTDPNQLWLGGALYYSTDDGVTWALAAEIEEENTLGFTTTELAAPATTALWDEVSTVNGFTYKGALESRTETEVLQGANLFLIGTEVVGARDVTLETDGSWTLSGLLRGARATEDQVGAHVAGEAFALLDGTQGFLPISLAARGQERLWKFVPLQGDVDDFDAQALTVLDLATVRPFPPGSVRGRWQVDDDIRLTWVRRSRAIFDPLVQDAPLLDPPEAWEVDIYDGAAVVRTLTASTPLVMYTAAQQVEDFGAEQVTLDVAVYLVSSLYGRGKGALATLTPADPI